MKYVQFKSWTFNCKKYGLDFWQREYKLLYILFLCSVVIRW